MKWRELHLVLIIFLFASWTPVSSKYPTDYFELPFKRAILLSGTFGELRTGHFHSGIDIKSNNGKAGEEISAAAVGYITRIKVSPSGYGNAIYIAHPNGYTTVYAHLDRFTHEIANYVKDKQYELKRFSVDLYPKPHQFQFKKGQVIGYLGNSGSSSAPHLHFEIRRSSDQVPINPFLFGLSITDNISPEINALQVYYLNDKFEQINLLEYPLIRTASGTYTITDTLSEGAWRTGFAIKTIDKMDGVRNRNGIYKLQMQIDDEPHFSFAMDEVPFSKTRFLNAHIDYAARQNKKGYFHRCFKLPGNALNIYSQNNNYGVVKLYSHQTQKISIAVKDIKGNTSTLTFFIKRDSSMYESRSLAAEFSTDYLSSLTIKKPDFNCSIQKGSIYVQKDIEYHVEKPGHDTYAAIHHIGSEEIPLHKYMTISIKPNGIPSYLADKAYIGRINEDEIISYGGEMSSGFMTGSVREFGMYTVGMDTITPTIKPIQFNTKMQGLSSMRFSITDNITTSGRARGLRYDAHVDGKWILMEYDAKNDVLTHRFDDRMESGNHELVLKVRDDRNNEAVLRKAFVR